MESSTIAGKEIYFNEALTLMQDLHGNITSTGNFNYNLGNVYFQLENYPWALFYYLKAREELPRNQEVKDNLSATLAKLETPSPLPHLWIPFSFAEELILTQLFILLALLFSSLRIWIKNIYYSYLALGFTIFSSIALLFLAFQFYFSPIYGVITEATFLYKNPLVNQERVFLDPLPPGTILQVIGEKEEGKWSEVANENGIVGYVLTTKILL